MRRGLIALTVVIVLVGAAPASAQGEVVIIDVDMNLFGNEGDVMQVAQVSVDPALVGATCTGTAQTENNSSEHPNNDFILTSGGSTAVIPDYESVAGQITSMTAPLVLGETITASIRLGPDGIASQGVLVTLACVVVSQPPPTTTTTTTPPTTTTTTTTTPPTTTTTTTTPPPTTTTTTTTPPPTTTTTTTTPPPTTTTTTSPQATTTTEEPPEGGVKAGGGGTASSGDDTAAWWFGAGTLTLLGALVTLAVARGRLSSGN